MTPFGLLGHETSTQTNMKKIKTEWQSIDPDESSFHMKTELKGLMSSICWRTVEMTVFWKTIELVQVNKWCVFGRPQNCYRSINDVNLI